jgi:hypothetical protein
MQEVPTGVGSGLGIKLKHLKKFWAAAADQERN